MNGIFTANVEAWDRLIPTVPADNFKDVLVEEWTVEWKDNGLNYRFTIPEGYPFNPSVPGIFSPLVPASRLRHASAPHDWGYKHQGDVDAEVIRHGRWEPLGRPLTRKELDRAFIIHARQVGKTIRAKTITWRLFLTYIGVRIGGLFYWHT